MKIAILGFGTIGQGIYHILNERRSTLEKQSGRKIVIDKILVRDLEKERGQFSVSELPLTDSFLEILDDDSIDLVFEVMCDGVKGAEFIRQLLARGKHVISANKAAIASDFFELQKIARKSGVHLRFEAAAAGGIPLLDPLSKIRHLNIISYLGGIINSSTNYILSELSKEKTRDEVLAEAKSLGVLEADPTNDVEGYDARRKIAILAAITLQQEIRQMNIPTIGISSLSEEDFTWAKANKRIIKLVAALTKDETSYQLSVLPTALPESVSLANVGGIMNQVELKGDTIGLLSFSGTGGGMLSTAHGLWVDFLDVTSSEPVYHIERNSRKEDRSFYREAEFYIRELGQNAGKVSKMSVADALDYRDQGFTVIERI
ncbi:MAG: homoserine dehydrogenase [Fastidiosipila sp.]|nr:homoserine dehydrogenase [Fastidiosipila sp.]